MTESAAGNDPPAGGLYAELKRRRVFRVATLYVVLLWPVIQIADILSPALDLPPETMRWLLLGFVGGLPVALALSWLYDLNRSGIVRASEGPSERGSALLGRRVERVIIGALLVVIAGLGWMQYRSETAPPVVEAPTPQPTAPESSERSLAVLPFEPFSSNPDDAFFADGLTEELLNILSSQPGLRVTARTSSFAYKGVNRKVQDIGRELNVETILEGSVRRNDVDSTIRVTAQLIDVATGSHYWSKTFDREFRDVFQIQDDIARAVRSELQVTLLDGVGDPGTPTQRNGDPETLVLLSMARAELAKRNRQNLEDAVRFFDRARQRTPESADALAGIAKANALLYDHTLDRSTLRAAESAIADAVSLAPYSAEVHATRGLIAMQRQDFPAAREALGRALELNPSHAMATMWLGNLAETVEQRLELHRKAFMLDPRSAVAGYNLANDLVDAGREVEAMDIFSQIVAADPYYAAAYRLVGRINESRGRLDEAIRHYQHAWELDPRPELAGGLARLYLDIGEFDLAERWIFDAETTAGVERIDDLAWLKVSLLAARGGRTEAEAAMRELMRVSEPSVEAWYNATTAAYFLELPDEARRAFEQAEAMLVDDRGFDDVEAQVAAAHAYAVAGDMEAVAGILDPLAARLDEKLAGRDRVAPEFWYVRAQIHAIRGEDNLALIHLQRALDEGWRQHWRMALEPCFDRLADNARYVAMRSGLETRMALMREQLAFNLEFAAQGG